MAVEEIQLKIMAWTYSLDNLVLTHLALCQLRLKASRDLHKYLDEPERQFVRMQKAEHTLTRSLQQLFYKVAILPRCLPVIIRDPSI